MKYNFKKDILISIILLTIGFFTATSFLEHWDGVPQFYQKYFGPSVMQACGKGYVEPSLTQAAMMQDFLSLKSETFDCSQLSNDIVDTTPKYYGVNRYFFGVITLVWLLKGEVSWGVIQPLYGIFFGLSIAISYGIFRFWMGRLLSIFSTLVLALSSVHLLNLPHLRDYSKAPFILAVILIISLLIKVKVSNKNLLIWSSACGVIVGLGFGLRTDIIILIPAFVVCIFFFMPYKFLENLKGKFIALTIFVLSFFVVSWPVINQISAGGNTFHVIILGLMSYFDQPLGIKPSPLYQWGYLYNDAFIETTLNSYSYRVNQDMIFHPISTADYDQIGFQYWMEIIKNFPADMLTRLYASALKIIELPFSSNNLYLPHGEGFNIINNLSFYRSEIMGVFNGIGRYFILVTILIFSKYNIKIGAAIIFYLLFLAGYPSLQFHDRHYFHLEFISLCFWGFLIQQIFKWRITDIRGSLKQLRRTISFKTIKRPFYFWVCVVAVLFFSLGILRFYQTQNIEKMINMYLASEIESINTVYESNNDRYMIRGDFFRNNDVSNFQVQSEYLMIEFENQKNTNISPLPLTVKFSYESKDPFFDFSNQIKIYNYNNGSKGNAKLYFPIYNTSDSQFVGLEMKKEDTKYLKGVYRIKNNRYPLMMILNIPYNWQKEKMYQTIETNTSSSGASFEKVNGVFMHSFPSKLELKPEDIQLTNPITYDMITYKDEGLVNFVKNEWHIQGESVNSYSYLITGQSEDKKFGDYLVLKGELNKGGLQFGLLKDGQWNSSITVENKGNFIIVIQVQEDGNYVPIVANYLRKNLYTDFKITEVGWINKTKEF